MKIPGALKIQLHDCSLFRVRKAPSSLTRESARPRWDINPSTATTAIFVREGDQTKTSKRRLASPHHNEGDRRERGDIQQRAAWRAATGVPRLRGCNDHRHQPLPKRPRLL